MYFLRIAKEMKPKDCILFQFCIPCSKEVGVIALGPWESELNTLNTMCKESDINIWCYIQTQIKSLSYHLYYASHLLFEKKKLGSIYAENSLKSLILKKFVKLVY